MSRASEASPHVVTKFGPEPYPIGEPVVESPSKISQIGMTISERQAVACGHERNNFAARPAGAEVIGAIYREQAKPRPKSRCG